MGPPKKRTKVNKNAKNKLNNDIGNTVTQIKPKLFAPFRSLGFISNQIAFKSVNRSTRDSTKLSSQIVTCLGKSWAMWDTLSMKLLFISHDQHQYIQSIENDGNCVFTTNGTHISRYYRGKEINKFINPNDNDSSDLSQLLLFGNQILALKSNGRGLLIWDLKTNEYITEIQFNESFTAVNMLHPSTYLNKIIVASAQGDIQLWNVKTMTLIYSFSSSHLRRNLPGSVSKPITALQQSPAIDVIAIGYIDGLVSLYDIRTDEELLRVRMDGDVTITSITFRSDGEHVMATSGSNGSIAFWNLNERGRLINVLRDAHTESVSKVEFLPNQPVLVSSSGDNSLKQWLFDSPSVLPRLLKFRAGHTQPPHLIRYYGDDGKVILSAGRDNSLRYLSVVRDSRSFEMSQGSLAKKSSQLELPISALRLPSITSLSFSTQRSKDWDDVLTSHSDNIFAYTWQVLNKKLGKHKLTSDEGPIKCVCVSVCGNYGFVGTTQGKIIQFNMQSGIKRRTFTIDSKYETDDAFVITGISTDAMNKVLIASTLDGHIYFFDFHNGLLVNKLQLPANINQQLLQRENGLMALNCGDNILRVVDIESLRIVREFKGFTKKITDMTFSPDSKWLVACSYDNIIRTFDIPTGALVDAFRVISLPTSITFSPTGDFVATTHADSIGVYLWANKSQLTEISLKPIKQDDVIDVGLPSMQGEVEDEELENLPDQPLNEITSTTHDQLSEGLLTLSTMPRTRWQTLLNLDTIKERNKPVEPPKAPEKAPFFLPSMMEANNNNNTNMEIDTKEDSHRLEQGATGLETPLTSILKSQDSDKLDKLFEHLHKITPANNDLEVRSLLPVDLNNFLVALTERLKQQKDFDTIQANLGLSLRVHADILASDKTLKNTLQRLNTVQQSECRKLFDLVSYSLGVLSFVRDIPLQ